MRYDAVIFDLFGTLIDNFSITKHEQIITEMTKILEIPRADFAPLWNNATWVQRATGVFPTPHANIAYVCEQLGRVVSAQQIEQAAQLRIEFSRQSLVPRAEAISTIQQLRSGGLRVGLISDCSSEIPMLWNTTPFAGLIEQPIFSSQVGMKKPDPRIYHLACERLGVAPERCLYVGDGSSGELTGAQTVGMTPILIRDSVEESGDPFRRDVDAWQGRTITHLSTVLELIDEERNAGNAS